MAESNATPGTSAADLTFTFSTKTLRVITIDGEPWFCAADVCDVLGYTNSRKAIADHCRARGVTKRYTTSEGDVSKRDTTSTARQSQLMTYINEGNLYRLCTKSHKPEAQRFEDWVCDEVLPAIRKTGRYVAANDAQATTTPAPALAERLNGSDMLNIKRMMYFCIQLFQYKSAWSQGLWFHLRTVLHLPSPQPLTVEHLPALAAEMARMYAITYQVQAIVRDVEAQAIKRIFRRGEAAELVLADIKRQADADLAKITEGIDRLPAYLQHDHTNLITRAPHWAGADYGVDEVAGYFDHMKGAAA